jgi:hypothetical protein
MTQTGTRSWQTWILGGLVLLSTSVTGCFQANVGGQTLPSAHYLDDDVQYFPAGPETRLYNQIRALERYKLQQQGATAPGEIGPGPTR